MSLTALTRAGRWGLLAMALAAGACAAASPPAPVEPREPCKRLICAQDIEAHIRFLADDALEGREAGTLGYDKAARYVADAFAAMGLAPIDAQARDSDTRGYAQPVPLLRLRRVEAGAQLTIEGDDGPQDLTFGEAFYVRAHPQHERSKVSAQAVFAGFGIVAPDHDRNDYQGLDVAGKIAVVFAGAPDSIDADARAHYAATRTKLAAAADHGAIGLITVFTPALQERLSFARAARATASAGLSWRRPPSDPQVRHERQMQVSAAVSLDAAPHLFVSAPWSLEDALGALDTLGAEPPRGPLNIRITLAQTSDHDTMNSPNIVGVLPGADPARRDELVVVTAHLDHLGLSDTVEADRINNGALDNAAGVAALLEVAEALSARPPARTMVFAAVTAEEQGLIGSEYFVKHPPLAGEFVANINLDMPVLLYDFVDVIAYGGERSTLGPVVAGAAAQLGLAVIPDPMPDQSIFTRSDHYRFVQAGVPAVMIATGFGNGGDAAFTEFLATRYHAPDDDLSAPINYAAGALYARLNALVARAVADADDAPLWRAGDPYAQRYGGRMETAGAEDDG